MRVETRKLQSILGTALALVTFVAGNVQASPVSITGGFTSFNGATSGVAPGCDTSFRAVIAGTVVNAPTCTSAGGIYGAASYTFPSTLSSVEFYETQFGSDLPHNNLTFTPNATADVEIGEYFELGTLSITNGTWFGLGNVNRFHIDLVTSSANPLLNGHVLSEEIVWGITANSTLNTPEQNADYIYLTRFLGMMGALWVYEAGAAGHTNTTTATLYGRIGSLIPTSFGNVTGGFVTPSLDPTPVPEPMSLVLIGSGVAMLGVYRRMRRKSQR